MNSFYKIINDHPTLSFLTDYLDENQEIESWDEIEDKLRDGISEQDVVYYSRAMEYLLKNDPSLQISLELANDSGYTADKLNSELLATLLYQQNLNEELSRIIYAN